MTERGEGLKGQLRSYEIFKTHILRDLFQEVFPIPEIHSYGSELRFVRHYFGTPPREIKTCLEEKTTFSAPLRIKLILEGLGTYETKEQDLYMAEFPLMTTKGTFIINGSEYKPAVDASLVFEKELKKGLRRMATTTRKLMAKTDPAIATPSGLISNRPFLGAIKRSLVRISPQS